MKKKISTIQILRAVSQLVFLFILPALVGLAFGEMKALYIGIINGTLSFTSILSSFGILIALIPITMLFGRFFCGWVCAFGALNDLIYAVSQKIFKMKFKVSPRLDSVLKYIKYIILVFIIVVIWTLSSTVFDSLSPWSAFGNITDIPDALTEYSIGFIVLAVVMVGALFIERFFCRYLCPLGAVLAVLSRFRLFNISKPGGKCEKCRICTNNCAMGIELYKTDKVISGECINCFKCLDACPRNNTQASIYGEDINPTLASAAAITIFTGVYAGTSMINGLIGSLDTSKYTTTQSTDSESSESSSTANYYNNSQSSTSTQGNGSTTSSAAGNTTDSSSSSSEQSTASSTTSTDVTYKDGTYTGTARGYHPGLTVSVTVTNGKIAKIEITSHNESKGFYERAFSVVPQEIIDEQSTSVDAVSGATRSSNGIMNAVANALQNAKA